MKPAAGQLSRLLAVALEAAERAGEQVECGWRQRDSIEVACKGAGDLVTSVDFAAETAAVDVILRACPGHAILSEEAGTRTGRSAYLWVIDPLDGSVNFAHGVPHCAVSIACLYAGEPVVAVIADPLRNETWTAMRGCGAWQANTALRVSSCDRIGEALLATVFPKPHDPRMSAYMPALHAALLAAQGVRRSGSMVLDLAYLASGRMDGFWQAGMRAWDLAAGHLLIEEAGGRMILLGEPEATILDAEACVAASPGLITALAQMLGDFYSARPLAHPPSSSD